MASSLSVEIFSKGKFFRWFPSDSMAQVFKQISDYEKVSKLSELKLTYLIFQNSKNGQYKGLDGNYHLVCRINATGHEQPKFFTK